MSKVVDREYMDMLANARVRKIELDRKILEVSGSIQLFKDKNFPTLVASYKARLERFEKLRTSNDSLIAELEQLTAALPLPPSGKR